MCPVLSILSSLLKDGDFFRGGSLDLLATFSKDTVQISMYTDKLFELGYMMTDCFRRTQTPCV